MRAIKPPTPKKRRQQLEMLIEAIQELIIRLENIDDYRDLIPEFMDYLADAKQLLEQGFDQDKLNALSRKIKPIIHPNPQWEPPLQQAEDGSWKIPAWFDEFEIIHRKVMDLAFELRVIGRT